MARFLLFLLFILFLTGSVYAQDALTGRVYEEKINTAIPGIVVRNLNSNRTALTDQTGGFSIPAKIGDLVSFTGFSYQPDTIYVKDLKYVEIILALKGKMLKEVTVTQQEVKVGSLKAPRTLSPINSDALVYSRNDNGAYKGGMTANIFDSNQAAKKRQKAVQVEKDGAIKQKISETFSAINLQNYLPIKGQEMQNFIILYTPGMETYTSADFNFTLYLSTCYREFLKIPEDQRRSKQLTDLKGDSN